MITDKYACRRLYNFNQRTAEHSWYITNERMRTILLIVLVLLLTGKASFAQADNVTLLAQSVDGKTVKLFWFIRSWNSSYTGFDIKRKDGIQDWVKLNTAPILPGITTKKKFSASGNNLYDESLLKAKLYKLLKSHVIQETEYTKYLQKLNSDPKELAEISRLMAEDYDIAMLDGFGYVDHTLTKKMDYQYGLFIQGTNTLLATVSWNYGEIPDMDVVQELTSKSSPEGRGINVIWVADTAKIRMAHIAGFNIYRSGIRLNTTRIKPDNSTDPTVYKWYDQNVATTSPAQYSIAAESVFDIEGIIRSYAYDPADHPKDYKKAEVYDISSIGYYFKEGTSIKWNFPKEYERLIKGFYIEKDNMPAGYKQVTELLDPAMRSYTDKSPSQVNGYVKVRVNAWYKDRTNVPGTERLYCYLPVTEPPPPQNVKVKSISGDKKVTAIFSWDPPMAGDSVSEYYKVYEWESASKKFVPVSDQTVKGHSFTYNIQHGVAGMHQFCVTALTKLNNESSPSDTVNVQTPSLELPPPSIKRVIPDNVNKATIEWQYPDIADIKGFRLTQNGKIIASENELKKNARAYVAGKLDDGGNYEFMIMAVSENGVLSDNSAPFHVVVSPAK